MERTGGPWVPRAPRPKKTSYHPQTSHKPATRGSGSLSPRPRSLQSPSATLRCETLHFFHFAEEETGLSRLDKLCLIPAGLERAQLLRQDAHTHGRPMVIPSTAWRMRSAAKVKCQPETSDLDREQTGLPRGRCQLQPPQPLHLPASPREESPFI